MSKVVIFLSLIISLTACQVSESGKNLIVKDNKALYETIKNAQPGDVIIMANGVWKDVKIKFKANGTAENPITLKAETAGEVFIEGESYLKFGGEYLTVDGLYFRNGFTPSNAVVDFKINKEEVANHCRLTQCVIDGYNQMSRDRKDHWVEFWGRHNQMDHCYLAGKANEGPTVRVEIKGNRNIKNFHQIVHNHFGPRPRKGGPKGETLQLGDSFSSMSPSNTTVAYNLFEECNGEVEIISSKTNFNEFKHNVFYKSEGSLVTRHGNYCLIEGNYFIGDENSENIGGIRIINTGHKVINNYFYNLKGKSFRSPLAVMNGIPKSPLNRYNQVTDVVVAYNTYINCPSPWQFGVGTNISQSDVLPKSEIRSARPLRTVIANNIIYNEVGDPMPIVEHDKADGVNFKSNIISNQGIEFSPREGLQAMEVSLTKVGDYIMAPTSIPAVSPFKGFEFESITEDIMGNKRSEKSMIGAIAKMDITDPMMLDKSKYGTSWSNTSDQNTNVKTIEVGTESGDLEAKIKVANSGDNLILSTGVYTISSSIVINKEIKISANVDGKVEIIYTGDKNTPLFAMHPKGDLNISNITLKGNNTQFAFASLKENMSSHYMLTVEGCNISAFNYILKAYKQSYAEEITFSKSTFSNCANGIELSEETNDKGDYNVEFLTFDACEFDNIKSNVIDYYRGGYDESTIGGNLLVSNSTFTYSGEKETNGILINTRGIVNVDIVNNTFKNNSVKLVALLWGAKNNNHSNNTITNSGKIKVVENIKLTLVY